MESPFGILILAIVLVVFAVALVMIGIGIAIGLIVAAAIAALAGMGILTTSALAGVASRKPTTGLKVMFCQLGAIGGALAGAGLVGAYFLIGPHVVENLPRPEGLEEWTTVVIGGVAGTFSGVLLALLFNVSWDLGLRAIRHKLEARVDPGTRVASVPESDMAVPRRDS